MSLLHAYFNLRNQQAFRRLLDNSHSSQAASSSGGKSWNRPSPLSSNTSTSIVDVNTRDSQGRTVLHLAASATDAAATEYIRMLLAHPAINVNLPDKESHWTALHRALYNGNVASALLLLQRQDIDTSLKDLEGYRPFDLYNSTVEGTKPSDEDRKRLELYTWGANRNAALGQGDGDDRTYPDQVVIERPDISEGNSLAERFEPVRVKNVVMAKLHTAVVTGESRNNLLLCGFGNSGRLGSVHHTQYNLLPVAGLPSTTILAVALGQDHTLALTSTGEIYSWGLNRLSQLGYVIESSTPGAKEEVQTVPRKVPGLRNKFIIGIAACRTASACWSNEEVWTWGTNSGQLGYDKAAQPVQISPRRVTKVSQPVLAVSITDTAMACLLQSHDVICLWNDGYFRINFPSQSFPSDISASRYRPPRAVPNTSIQKVTSCDNTFAALSTNGELFTFSLPAPNELTGREKERGGALVKPQRVWALRKQFSAVKVRLTFHPRVIKV
ncbi:regulator of chromosome condensation 1/beta-lactamase-inhibitor protein II [Abortiporus biennis]|nr:regulator of chromosome condensation 1/beta-lactamase-inhibitor protein II [Abortiporus biennis]